MSSTALLLQKLVKAAEYDIQCLEKQANEDPEMTQERTRVLHEITNLYREHLARLHLAISAFEKSPLNR